MGSFNMDYQSMFDNLEQATFSRSTKYPEHFLSEWERLSKLDEE
jgi:phosphatidylserine/phosphatidylglycerophosphate/cardiolipin synthase-like enzyme